MSALQRWVATGLIALGANAQGASPTCLPQVAVPLWVRIGDSPTVAALLEGGLETPLRLYAATSGRLLWSADDGTAATQGFAGLNTPITGSITAIDLDGDGLHDRIYAGDMSARLWRFDLHHGSAATHWATGGVFADFTNTDGRGFLAVPDVSLSAPAGAAPWLNIAIGTGAPGNAAANNRFYALRDHAVHESWTADQYAQWPPMVEADLVRVNPTPQSMAEAAVQSATDSPGWYVELGSGHVIAPSLTVNDRVVLVIAETLPRSPQTCEVLARIASFELPGARVVLPATPGDWRTRLAEALPADAVLSVAATRGDIAPCTLAGQRITACDVDMRPRKTWWRRSDAE